MRILIVDDCSDTADLLARLLQRVGHETRTAITGSDALLLAAEFQPTATLLDLGLPKMDGYELARRLREVRDLARLRIVALSGTKGNAELAEAAGIDCHLLKPATLNDILEAIGELPIQELPMATQTC